MEKIDRHILDLGFANGWDSDGMESRLVEMAKRAGYTFDEKMDKYGYDNVYTSKDAALRYHTCCN